MLEDTTNDPATTQAFLMLMRNLNSSVNQLSKRVDSKHEMIMEVRDSVNEIKGRDYGEQIKEVKEQLRAVSDEFTKVKATLSEQRGMAKAVVAVKEFGPWLVTAVAGYWAFFKGPTG